MDGPLQEALQYIKQAVNLDHMGNYAEAIKAYKIGVELCVKAQSIETSPEILVALPDKIAEYTKRINILQFALIDSLAVPTGVPPKNNKSEVFSDLESSQGDSPSQTKMHTPPLPTTKQRVPPNVSVVQTTREVNWEEEDLPPPTQALQNDRRSEDFSRSQAEPKRTMTLFDESRSPATSIFLRTKRGESSLEKALKLCKKAKEQDRAGDYIEAFKLYIQCLEYFADAAKNSPSGILPQLNKTMKIYMSRAEKLKEVLDTYGKTPVVPKPEFPDDHSVDEYHINNARACGIDGRIGPLQKRVVTSFWNDSAPFMLQIKIPKNIYTRGETILIDFVLDNKGSIEVDALRVSLDQMDTETTANVGVKKIVKTKVSKINCEWYKEDNKFPCRRGNFKGTLKYSISTNIDITDCDNSACCAREYRLKVMCEIPNHQNIWLLLPLRIVA